MESNIWLTTVDNEYDPFKQFDSWFNFDVINNYNTCSQIARIANTSNSKSDEENKAEIEKQRTKKRIEERNRREE